MASKMGQLLQKLRYLIFIFSATSPLFPFFLVALFFLAIVLLGMGAYFVGLFSIDSLSAEGIDDQLGGGVIDTFWWSLKHVLDPGAFSEDYGAPFLVKVFAFVNTLMGLLFVGALIGFIVNSINSMMDQVMRGSVKVEEKRHVVILGWNDKVPSIINMLARGVNRMIVVILSAEEPREVRERLRQRLTERSGLRVLPQRGSAHLTSELDRVALRQAAAVIMVADDIDRKNVVSSDISTIKSLMLLKSFDFSESARPNLVVEVSEDSTRRLVEGISNPPVPSVSGGDFIGKTLVQCARNPGYSNIYTELLALRGYRLVISEFPEFEDALFGDVVAQFESAIPIGVSWVEDDGRRAIILNPELDYDLGPGDELVILSKFTGDLAWGPLDSAHLKRLAQPRFDASAEVEQDEAMPGNSQSRLERVAVVGYSSSFRSVLEALNGHATEQSHVLLLNEVAKQDELTLPDISELGELFPNLVITVEFLDFEDSTDKRIEECIANQEALILLADESVAGADSDASVAVNLLRLSDAIALNPALNVVIEVFESASSDYLAPLPVTDAVFGPELLSIQMAQIAMRPALAPVFRELLNAGGIEMRVRPLSAYMTVTDTIDFAQLQHICLSRNESALGIARAGAAGEVIFCPGSEQLNAEPDDKVIVLAQQLYM
ncbi:MAG: CASTOR/POLLUX-related putative ion channel [Pseudomonadales bacterium]